MIGTYVMSLGLLGLSGLLIDQHRRVWADAREDLAAGSPLHRFARSQFRRRMIGSSMIGVVGALIALHPIIPREPEWVVVYIASLLLGCLAIFTAGLIDALAGARHYRRARLEDRLKQAKLAFELQQQAKRTGERRSDDA